jgi:hypothetical protein
MQYMYPSQRISVSGNIYRSKFPKLFLLLLWSYRKCFQDIQNAKLSKRVNLLLLFLCCSFFNGFLVPCLASILRARLFHISRFSSTRPSSLFAIPTSAIIATFRNLSGDVPPTRLLQTPVSLTSNFLCILSRVGVTIDGVWIGEWIHWPLIHTTRKYCWSPHNSQITTAPSKSLPACCVFTSHSRATVSNTGNSSAPRTQVLPLKPPALNCLWTIFSSCL